MQWTTGGRDNIERSEGGVLNNVIVSNTARGRNDKAHREGLWGWKPLFSSSLSFHRSAMNSPFADRVRRRRKSGGNNHNNTIPHGILFEGETHDSTTVLPRNRRRQETPLFRQKLEPC